MQIIDPIGSFFGYWFLFFYGPKFYLDPKDWAEHCDKSRVTEVSTTWIMQRWSPAARPMSASPAPSTHSSRRGCRKRPGAGLLQVTMKNQILLAQKLECGSVLFPAGEAAGDVPSLCVSFSYFDPKFHQWMQCAAWCAIPLAFANGSCLSTDKFVLNIKILTNWHIPIREQKTQWYLSKHWDGGSHNDATNWCLHTFKWQWNDELFFF